MQKSPLCNLILSQTCAVADPLRAIILRDACLVFVPDGADSLLSILKEKFLEMTQHEFAGDVPYEFK